MNDTSHQIPIIRLARLDELQLLTEIEIDAFATLAAAMGDDREPHALPLEALRTSHDSGLLFVATDERDCPVAFLAGEEIDRFLYVMELDVRRQWQRRGLGRRLMLAAIAAGRARGLLAVALTTDRYVAFNAPFYRSLGLMILADEAVPAFLRKKLGEEIENGADPARRVGMALWFDTPNRV